VNREIIRDLQSFQNLLVDRATGREIAENEFSQLRSKLITNPLIKTRLPEFVHTCRTVSQFWQFIKQLFPTYKERREFIWNELNSIISYAEQHSNMPSDEAISQVIAEFNFDYIHAEWRKALDRRNEDPEAAITSARALLESVCKHILHDLNISYPENIDFPALYKLTTIQLNLAPDKKYDPIVNQILNGSKSTAEGIAALRNKLSDSHGKDQTYLKPEKHLAELAVNLTGALSVFLLACYKNFKNNAT
jgi:hypothetical protein